MPLPDRPRRAQASRRTSNDLTLAELGAELRRQRSRCRRLKRRADRLPTTAAWQEWSSAVDEMERLFEAIAIVPVTTLADIVIRYQALAWELLDGGLIIEEGARRRLEALGRELQRQTPTGIGGACRK